jgi:hypothetical protein
MLHQQPTATNDIQRDILQATTTPPAPNSKSSSTDSDAHQKTRPKLTHPTILRRGQPLPSNDRDPSTAAPPPDDLAPDANHVPPENLPPPTQLPQSTFPHANNPNRQNLYYSTNQQSNNHPPSQYQTNNNPPSQYQTSNHPAHTPTHQEWNEATHPYNTRPMGTTHRPSTFFDLVNNQISMQPNETPLNPVRHHFSTAHPTQNVDAYPGRNPPTSNPLVPNVSLLEKKFSSKSCKFRSDKFEPKVTMLSDDVLNQEAFSNAINNSIVICAGAGPALIPPYFHLQPSFTSTDIEMSLSNIQLCSVTQTYDIHD